MKRNIFSLVNLSCLVIALSGTTVSAQSTTAQISGIITDSSGSVVAGTEIAVTNAGTGTRKITSSDERGSYVLPLLEAGSYTVKVQKTGFRSVERDGVTLHVNDSVRLDFGLEIGSVAENIIVQEAVPLLEQSTSAVGQLIENKRIVDLPLNGRNPFSLAALAPGVQPQGGFFTPRVFQEPTLQANFTINGSASMTNEIMIDGTTNIVAGHGQLALTPSVDAIQEFKVLSSTFSAEFGRTGGGVVNIVTKAGTNQLHGSLYEFHRNKVLDANNFFNNRSGVSRQPFVFNQYGTVIGGPVRLPGVYNGKDRTFFFFGYEGVKVRRSVTFTGTVPNEQQKAGDFSGLRNSRGDLVTIYNPFTTRRDGAGFIRDVFPGNAIPLNFIDPVAKRILSYYPAPNQVGTPFTGANNFFATAPQVNDLDIFQGRVDHNFSANNRLFIRYSRDEQLDVPPNFFRNIATTNSFGPGIQPDHHATLADTHTFGPNTVMEIRWGYARNGFDRKPESFGLDLTTLGFPAAYNNALQNRWFPTVNVTGFSQLGQCSCALFVLGADTHSLSGQVTRIQGKHLLKTGAETRAYRHNSIPGGNNNGTFAFNAGFTQGPNPLTSTAVAGSSIASLLLGTPASGSVVLRARVSYETKYYAAFIQDDYRVSSRLTLNIGLRYDFETPRNERFDRLSYFDPDLINPVGAQVGRPDLRGGLGFVAINGQSRYQGNSDRNNFGPRFGFAYTSVRNTVLRGGYGIAYLPNGTSRNCCGGAGQDGFTATTPFLSSFDNVTPANRLANPYPDGLIQPTGSSLGPRTLLGQSFSANLRNLRVGYTQQFNLNLQRQLRGNLLVEAAYVGSRGVKLPQAFQLNQLPDEYLSLRSGLLDQVPNPYFGIVTAGPNSGLTIARGRLLRPFPQFDNLSFPSREAGSSTYHSLQLKIEKRFSGGLTLLGAYTKSKLISDIFSDKNFAGDDPAPVQNSNNRRLERAVSPQDISQRLATNFVYDLPFGKGKAFLTSASGLLSGLFGGWQLSGLTTFQTGNPIELDTSVNNTNSFGGGSRPNNNGTSAKLSSSARSLDRWFETSVFSQPAPFTFGSTGRTLPDVRIPGITNFDFSVLKNMKVRERAGVQLRGEFFNLFNTPQFGRPGQSFGTGQFGVISTQVGTPRQIQVGLKVIY